MDILSNSFTGGLVPNTIGGLGTTQKIFGATLAGVTANLPLSAGMPGGNRLNGHRFNVRMSGSVYVHGTSPTFQLQLLGFVPGGGNVILCQTAAQALTTNASYDWSLTASFIGSNAPTVVGAIGGAGSLTGSFTSLINGTVGALATLTNNLGSVNFALEPPFTFLAAGLFGVTDALNLSSLNEFFAFFE